MFSQKGNFYCKTLKNPHVFFYFAGEKSFSVFNKAPSDTLKVFVGKIINFFQPLSKLDLVSIQDSGLKIHWCYQKKYYIFVQSTLKFALVRVSCGFFLCTL